MPTIFVWHIIYILKHWVKTAPWFLLDFSNNASQNLDYQKRDDSFLYARGNIQL